MAGRRSLEPSTLVRFQPSVPRLCWRGVRCTGGLINRFAPDQSMDWVRLPAPAPCVSPPAPQMYQRLPLSASAFACSSQWTVSHGHRMFNQSRDREGAGAEAHGIPWPEARRARHCLAITLDSATRVNVVRDVRSQVNRLLSPVTCRLSPSLVLHQLLDPRSQLRLPQSRSFHDR